jgi:hypothetical protein
MLASTWDENNYIQFPQPLPIPLVAKSTFLLIKNGIYTLADVVIIDPTHVNLLP